MEEISPQDDHVHPLLHSYPHQLLKTVEAVISSLRMLLTIPQVDVTGYEDAEQGGVMGVSRPGSHGCMAENGDFLK